MFMPEILRSGDGVPTPEQARDLAIWLHGDQTDMGGQPYVGHFDAVVANLGPRASDKDKRVGYLHDTVEDVTWTEADGTESRLTPEELEAFGVPADEVRSIRMLSRDAAKEAAIPALPGESKAARSKRVYLIKIRSIIDADEPLDIKLRTIRVKKADNKHNMDPDRDRFLDAEGLRRSAGFKLRYAESYAMLDAAEISILEASGMPSIL
jgi:hypothetical protein